MSTPDQFTLSALDDLKYHHGGKLVVAWLYQQRDEWTALAVNGKTADERAIGAGGARALNKVLSTIELADDLRAKATGPKK
jgi:hypothetical protein